METQFLRLLVDQFGKFQKISSWFDPENPLMDVRNDSERVTHIIVHVAAKIGELKNLSTSEVLFHNIQNSKCIYKRFYEHIN